MTEGAENISRIRDILIGNNLNEFEKRMEKAEIAARQSVESVESQLNRQLSDLRLQLEDLRQQFQIMLQKEKEGLQDSLNRQREELVLVDQKIEQLRSEFEESLREIRQWMAEKSESLHQEQLTQLQEYKKTVAEAIAGVQQSKADRHALAVMFSELAVQLAEKKEG